MKALALLAVVSAAALANAAQPPAQTHFPGQVTAGGGTSGDVMSRAGELRNVADDGGTPGIPKGAGGNTAGPQVAASVRQSQLGGTGTSTQPSQASRSLGAAPAASGASPASAPAKSQAAAAEETAKLELSQAEDRDVTLWRSDHAAGTPGHVPTQAAPTTPRSEKLGTAPPSADVKQPRPGASGAAR